MEKSLERLFFKSFIEAITKEEIELNELFDRNSKEYQKLAPSGVSCLYETTYVYIAIKQLLKNKFPLLVSWEHSYTENNYSKVDMALLNAPNNINSFVEFKIWKSEDGHEIKSDIDKLKNEKSNISKYIVAIEYNSENIIDNVKFLTEEMKLEVVEYARLLTSYYDWESKCNKIVPVNIYLAKIKST